MQRAGKSGSLTQDKTPSTTMLMGNLATSVIALDQELCITYANPAAEQMLKSSANVLVGKELAGLVAPHAKILELARQVQRTGSSISDYGFELGLVRGDGMEVDCHAAPMVERPGHVVLAMHGCSVARRLDANRAHRGSTRSVAALAATLAHEVKNPLSGIRGAAQLLESYVTGEDRALVKLICDEADRIVGLVDRMEEFNEPGRLRREPVNIHQVLEHVRRIAENGFARHLRIVELYDPSLPDVEGDRDRLIQVFLNLIKNAAEAAPSEGGVVTLATHFRHGVRMSLNNSRERQDLPITVEIADNGPGVREDLVEHLFEPFVTTKPRGSGLGLSLVAKIVGDHGGIVAYQDNDPGALFRVQLPATRRNRAREPNTE